MASQIKITRPNAVEPFTKINAPYYFIILLDGDASFSVDFNSYTCKGKHVLFLSPYQLLEWESVALRDMQVLQFHGDFYCIEYHKEEVSCNGILFNNIYEQPFISVSAGFFGEIKEIFERIGTMGGLMESYNTSIVRTYLQLILALSSKEKQTEASPFPAILGKKQDIQNFNALLDASFSQSKSVAFYADKYGLSVPAFSKKIKGFYGKTPSNLIRERMVLEAKKLLHLTHKNIKEIAFELGFQDEFYFSRYFKKEVGVSPKTFRDTVGISVAAK